MKWLRYPDPCLTLILAVVIFSAWRTDFTGTAGSPATPPLVRMARLDEAVSRLFKTEPELTAEVVRIKVRRLWDRLKRATK